MAADFSKPTVSELYTNVPTQIRDNDSALAKMDFTGASNVPTGAIQYDGTNYEFEKHAGGGTYNPLFTRQVRYAGTSAGTSTAYTLNSIAPALPSNLGGETFLFFAHTTCGASPTLQISSNTARGLYDITGRALFAGQIQSGQRVEVIYDETNNRWVVISPLYTGPFTYTPTGSSDSPSWGSGGVITVTVADVYVEFRKVTVMLEVYAAAASGPLQLIISTPSFAPCVASNHRGCCQGTDTNGSQPYNVAAHYAVNNGGINVYKVSGATWTSSDSAGAAGTFVYTRT